jgi:FKBP-type peptidyl-prolyl cis-trans isomerase 2
MAARFANAWPVCVAAAMLSLLTMAGCSDWKSKQKEEPVPVDTRDESTPKVVQVGDEVKVHYTGRLQDGTVFDSSKGGPPLKFHVGKGEMIPGFDAGVIGMTRGQTKTLTLPPESAYGLPNPQLIRKLPRTDAYRDVRVGGEVMSGSMKGKVIKVEADAVTVDFNHELAGKTLIFEVELVGLTKGQ